MHFDLIVTKLNRFEVIDKLKNHIPKYEKNKDVFDLLLKNRLTAIENAKKLNELHERNDIELNSVESNPSTQVYSIVEEILKNTAPQL